MTTGTFTAVLRYAVTAQDRADVRRGFRDIGDGLAAVPGLVGNELWWPSEGGEALVVTRWVDEQSFVAWAGDPVHRARTASLDTYREAVPRTDRLRCFEVVDRFTYHRVGAT